ncbi:HpcH/HpaI aldolase family protein [Draconibacterium mangrovi]|uniref:HpcH/HpaI aldolase family protein n=1 Tax=Draconibacterium mangrovi TaxID=2697469 RepID=UPI0013D47C28|nr:aldolase/citrate lyase family protein [Draconibacterium mangrovi]
MKYHPLKEKLSKNELTIGSWITIGHTSVIEILSHAGFDWLTIDLEHTTLDLTITQNLIASIQSYDMAALVRVSKNEEVIIKRVLDAGANGVIVPMVSNADDARKAVEFAKYPPVGKRGVGLNRAQQYGYAFNEYKEWVDKNSVLIAQIEHIDGIHNIEEIIQTPGIDGVIIGPYDLSGSMGYPGEYERADVKTALEKFKAACQKNKKSMGFHVIDPDSMKLKEKIEEGYNFIAFSTDFLFMGKNAELQMKKIIE